MAREIAREFERYGGILTEADFSEYRSIVVPHSRVVYTNLKKGRVICGPPPPSGSAVAQAILNILDGYEYNMKSFSDTAWFHHHFIESSKFASKITEETHPDEYYGGSLEALAVDHGTSHISVAYLTELASRGHVLKKVQNLTVVTAAEKAADGQLYANSDFRKGEESSPAGY
ncbi:hypothetical protein TELCIR_15197 [Teladorsagia circumcincta]|uniref:Gamma-glutamyltranspeptidase n=1 Tax=Teladorsagia circumcincta TaxID=45464 RepID=A0A2G9TYW0_TELCI|nr:hypothetical protein TELCIR_15197 [Teladorsagia circumcincta]